VFEGHSTTSGPWKGNDFGQETNEKEINFLVNESESNGWGKEEKMKEAGYINF
jgi:hypothetical protein